MCSHHVKYDSTPKRVISLGFVSNRQGEETSSDENIEQLTM